MTPPVLEQAAGPFKCPFCSGLFSVSDPQIGEQAPAILHTLPTCKEYDNIQTLEDAIRYMKCSHN